MAAQLTEKVEQLFDGTTKTQAPELHGYQCTACLEETHGSGLIGTSLLKGIVVNPQDAPVVYKKPSDCLSILSDEI